MGLCRPTNAGEWSMMHRLVATLVLSLGLLLLLGFGGRFHGAGDSLAVGRPLVVLGLAVFGSLLITMGRWRLGVVGMVLAVLGAVSLVPGGGGTDVPETGRTYAAYQKNLLFLLPDVAPVVSDIETADVDFVMLQEVHARNRPILDALRREYPHQHLCPFAAVGGVAVLSRWPIVERRACRDASGLAMARVETPDGLLWIVSVHLHWPFPYGQAVQLESALPDLATLEELGSGGRRFQYGALVACGAIGDRDDPDPACGICGGHICVALSEGRARSGGLVAAFAD